MITCGLKLTQSGGVALFDDDELLLNVEVQKVDNNPRYSYVTDLEFVPRTLAQFGYSADDVHHWVVDGWDGARTGTVSVRTGGAPLNVTVAPYRETIEGSDLVQPLRTGQLPIDGRPRSFSSYVHTASHFAAAYCTSPFAARGEEAIVMVWDGGCFPRLYHVDPERGVTNGGEAFPLIGHTYAMGAQHFGPWRRPTAELSTQVDDFSVAGKLMAYIALGTPRDEIQRVMRDAFERRFEAPTPEVADYRRRVIGCGSTGEPSHRYVHAFLTEVRGRVEALGASDDDVLASMHEFLERMLVERVTAKIRAWKGDGPHNLCFAGGCALNIKWNSALRAHPLFADVWVPPFPDDSGSAIGTACAHLAGLKGPRPVGWQVRLGPELVRSPHVPAGWTARPCRPEELARIMHLTGKPAVFLRDRAELGPRALGVRSVLAPATEPGMKDLLNTVKDREYYRPVAPICLQERAGEIFDPGTPDPYMLFEHVVRPDWLDRVPAIVHLDGTARLQTVSVADDPVLAQLLREYAKWSGIPVLCNTSANRRGRGFFPDVASALDWGRIDLVWADGVLYQPVSGKHE